MLGVLGLVGSDGLGSTMGGKGLSVVGSCGVSEERVRTAK